MAIPPPDIHTYHCICTALLLSTTHTLSHLPRRRSQNASSTSSADDAAISDEAIILPLPSSPPTLTSPHETTIPSQGYTIFLSLAADRKTTIIRRADGFEKRVLYRCARCGVVVGYEIVSASAGGVDGEEEEDGERQVGGDAMDVDKDSTNSTSGKDVVGSGDGERKEKAYRGKILYILPGGVMSTDVMAAGGVRDGKKIGEGDVEIVGGGRSGAAVFE